MSEAEKPAEDYDRRPCCANCVHHDPELETVDLLGMQLALADPSMGLRAQAQALGLAPQDAVARPAPAVPMRKGACREAQTGARYVAPGDRCGRHPFLKICERQLTSLVTITDQVAPIRRSDWEHYLQTFESLRDLLLPPPECEGEEKT